MTLAAAGSTGLRQRMAVGLLAGAWVLTLSACGGGNEDAGSLMPSVEDSRLDVALADLEEQGIPESEVDVIGGGAFGIVDESNWIVCEQRPGPGEPIDVGIRLTVDRSCGSSGSSGSGDAGASSGVPAATGQPPDPVATSENPPDQAETFVVPDLTGMNLQLAQDTLQSLGSYLIDQEDASGLDRIQVLDSNWQVCSQSPPAGTMVPVEAVILLASVKLGESCP